MKYLLFIIAFIFTVVVSYKLGQSHSIPVKVNTHNIEQNVQPFVPFSLPKKTALQNPLPIIKKIIPTPQTLDESMQLLKTMDDTKVDVLFENIFSKYAVKNIDDKKDFLKKIAHIYFEDNTTIDSDIVGESQVYVSSSPQKNETAIEELEITTENRNIILYAHIELDESYLNKMGAVFIKWINTTTQKTILFERKAINVNAYNNWVSFKPYTGWEKGDYHVKIFSFSNTLLPIAETHYILY